MMTFDEWWGMQGMTWRDVDKKNIARQAWKAALEAAAAHLEEELPAETRPYAQVFADVVRGLYILANERPKEQKPMSEIRCCSWCVSEIGSGSPYKHFCCRACFTNAGELVKPKEDRHSVCQWCGGVFQPIKPEQRFCSIRCLIYGQ